MRVQLFLFTMKNLSQTQTISMEVRTRSRKNHGTADLVCAFCDINRAGAIQPCYE